MMSMELLRVLVVLVLPVLVTDSHLFRRVNYISTTTPGREDGREPTN